MVKRKTSNETFEVGPKLANQRDKIKSAFIVASLKLLLDAK